MTLVSKTPNLTIEQAAFIHDLDAAIDILIETAAMYGVGLIQIDIDNETDSPTSVAIRVPQLIPGDLDALQLKAGIADIIDDFQQGNIDVNNSYRVGGSA